MLKIHDKAPDFSLEDKDGNVISLSAFLGKKVVVYFYPKDNTSGCSLQAKKFSENYDKFQELNIPVIGISKDSGSSHAKFIAKYDLPFILLSDPTTQTIQDYGVWGEKTLYGKKYMGTMRTTFLVDEKGYIENIWEKAKPETNSNDVLQYINEMCI